MTRPRLAFFCATYLKPEMLHVHRQITSLPDFDTRVIAQKIENRERFPFDPIDLVPRSRARWLARIAENHLHAGPWQASRRETADVLRIIRSHQIDVLHLFFGNVAVHWLRLLRECPVPVVVSFHGADVAGEITHPDHGTALQAVLERAAILACRSDALGRRVVNLGGPPEKIRVARTVVPELPAREDRAADTLRVVQASRLIPKKGLKTTMMAFASVRKLHPAARLVIAGDGPMMSELQIFAAEAGIAEAVEFSGFLDQAALVALLRQTAVFLHPSESVGGDTEGIPNSMLEAMAVGVPVIATRHGGIPEVVVDGANGLLVEESAPDALADALARLLSDPVENRRIGQAGRDTVREQFSEASGASALGTMYRSVIPGG